MEGYDLVICESCGAAFADRIPAQETFDRYYERMSKYEYSGSGGTLDETTAARYRQVLELLAPHVSPEQRIADIGCATGGLLGEFKKRGFRNVQGFDPSPACAEVASRLHGVPVTTGTIADLPKVRDRFDLILLTGVMEHVRDVDPALETIISLLSPQGRLYLEVPDVTRYERWFSAPYQFLSMEHVNFFSPGSLAAFLGRHGMQRIFVERVERYLSPKAGEPAVAALFQRIETSPTRASAAFDRESGPALQAYLEKSRILDEHISRIIGDLVASGAPLAVWGTGTHTLRLLKTSSLARGNIIAFIDSNRSYQDKKLYGIPIIAPSEFRHVGVPILISSHAAEAEIKDLIQGTLRWTNPVVTLYEGSPLETNRAP